jgi:hypothetical protein
MHNHNAMKSISILTIILLGQLAFAQSPATQPEEPAVAEPVRGRRGFELYLTQFFTISQAGGINTQLRETGYPEVGGLQVFWGGGAQYRLNRLLLGFEMAHTVNPYGPRLSETATARRSAYLMQLNAYYVLFEHRNLRFYPFVGSGGMETTLTLSRNTPDGDFKELLTQPGNAVALTHFQGTWNFGVGFDALSENVGSCIMAQFRIGYRAGDYTAWYSDHTVLRDAPRDRMTHFYVQFTLGGAWNRLSPRQRAYRAGR